MAHWHAPLSALSDQESPEVSASNPDSPPAGIWAGLKTRSNPYHFQPQANPIVETRALQGRAGAYYVLKNPDRKTYLRLSPQDFELFSKMDGGNSVQDLIVDHYMQAGEFAHKKILRLLSQLHAQGMLVQTPISAWTQLREKLQSKGWAHRLSAPAGWLLTQKLSIRGIDGFLGWLYRTIGWLFFTRPAQVLFLAVSVAGLAAFFQILGNTSFTFMEANFGAGLWLWWVAALAPVVIHELGHALTVKHYGREVPRGGLMLFFGLPAAFVETTDIWLEERRARLAVTWNGPYTGLILGGAASIAILAFPASSAVPLLIKMAGIAYASVFFNVNPLLKFDGYYLLVDALDIPSLREKSLGFMRERLLGRRNWGRLSKVEWVYLVYGILTFVWMGYAMYLAFFFWQIRLQAGMQAVLGAGYPLFARVMGFLGVAGLASFLVLIGLRFVQVVIAVLKRLNQSRFFTRHYQLALILGLAAVGAGTLVPVEFLFWPAAALALLSGGLVFRFSAAYTFSMRQAAYFCFGAGPILLAAQAALPGISGLGWAGGAALIAGGLLLEPRFNLVRDGLVAPIASGLLVWPLAILAGISWREPHFWWATVSAAMGVRSFLAIFRGARAAGFLLLYAGAALAWLPGALPGLGNLSLLLLAAGGLQMVLARMPVMKQPELEEDSVTSLVVGGAMNGLVHRLIGQVYFESGLPGVARLGEKFGAEMQRYNLDISIQATRLEDPGLANRAPGEIPEVYGLVLESLYGRLEKSLGRRLARQAFLLGIDQLPWQNREVVREMILSRLPWGWLPEKEPLSEVAQLREMLRSVPLFVTLPNEPLDEIAHRLVEEHFAAGETVISQGERGDKFFILASGKVAVYQADENGRPQLVEYLGRGQYFGEQALISDQPRNATLKTVSPSRLFSMDRAAFNALVRQYVSLEENLNRKVRHSWLLRGMPIFDTLQSHELDWLALQLNSERYRAGEVVFREGDTGDRFYLIESGRLAVTRKVRGETVQLSQRGAGEYFGEIALLEGGQRSATLTAQSDARLLSLTRSQFQELLDGYRGLAQAMSTTGSRRQKYIERTLSKVEAR